MNRGKGKHTPATRAKIAEAHRAYWNDPAKRAAASEATKSRMADPAVRQRIKDRMRDAAGQTDELRTLRIAWRSASHAVRVRFIAELLSPAGSTSTPELPDRNQAQ